MRAFVYRIERAGLRSSIRLLVILFFPLLICVFATKISHVTALPLYAGVVVLILAFRRPELLIVLIPFFATRGLSMWGWEEMPTIPLPVGRFHVSDVLLLVLCIPIFKDFVEKRSLHLRSPLTRPVGVFFLYVIFQFFLGLFYRGDSLHMTLKGMRPLASYSVFFLILYHIRGERQKNILLGFLVVYALVASGAMVAQFVVGSSAALFGSTTILHQSMGGMGSFTRLYLWRGTNAFFVFVFILSFWWMVFERSAQRKVLCLIVMSITGTGILLTFGRGLWVSTIVGLIVPGIVLVKQRRKLLKYVLVASVFFGILLSLSGKFSGQSYASLFQRRLYSGVEAFVHRSGSFGGRLDAIQQSIPILRSHWFFGVGIAQENFFRLTKHYTKTADSGYWALVLAFGLPGLCFFLWMILAFIPRALYVYRHVTRAGDRALIAGFLGTLACHALRNIGANYTMFEGGIIIMALSMGLTEVVYRQAARSAEGAGDQVNEASLKGVYGSR